MLADHCLVLLIGSIPLMMFAHAGRSLPGRQTGAYSEVLEQAEYFESWIQGFRRRRLSELFGGVEEVLYCAGDMHSQQNRCLVAGRRLQGSGGGSGEGSGEGSDETGHAAFFALLERQFLKYETVLPMDLRVRGIVSSKFDYDGSELLWDPAMADDVEAAMIG